MGKDAEIKMKSVIPQGMRKGLISCQITHDFVLEIYEKAKRARSEKRKKELLNAAEQLSKHIGKWLVE